MLSTPSNLLELNSQIKVFNQTYKDIWKNEEYRKLFEENNSYKMKIEPIKVQIDSIEKLVTSEIESYAITSIKKDISTRPYDLKLYFLTLAQGIRVSDIPVQAQKKWAKMFQNELKQYRLLQEEKNIGKIKQSQYVKGWKSFAYYTKRIVIMRLSQTLNTHRLLCKIG